MNLDLTKICPETRLHETPYPWWKGAARSHPAPDPSFDVGFDIWLALFLARHLQLCPSQLSCKNARTREAREIWRLKTRLRLTFWPRWRDDSSRGGHRLSLREVAWRRKTQRTNFFARIARDRPMRA